MQEIKRFGVTELPKEYIGTNAERTALDTTGLPAGSTFYETDTKSGYLFDGSIWHLV